MYHVPTVHIVDDDDAIRTALSMLFRVENIPSETYGSAEEFLEQHAQLKVGCLLLDICMHGMDGLELLDTINGQNVSIPVIFITGQGDFSHAVRAVKAGAVDFIEKPFDNSRLLSLVRDCLAKSSRLYNSSQHQNESGNKDSPLVKYGNEEMECIVDVKKVVAK